MKYYNLTTPQENIWNLQKYYADTSISNICGAVFYNEKRDSTLLQRSIRLFIKNQSGIRLRFVEGNEPQQYVSEEIVDDIPIMVFQSMKDFNAYVEQFTKEPIGLTNRALYRFVVFQVGNRSGILVLLSHLISDAWTYGLMANQFDKAYYKLLNNSDETLIEGNYIDYIHSEKEYRKSLRYEKDKKYWEEKYTLRPEESLIKISLHSFENIKAKRITETLPLFLEQKIAAYCKDNPVTQAVLFEMAVIIYLSKINMENKSITIGVPMLNRSNVREKNIAGMFISTMPLTVTLTENMTVSELAGQISKGHIDIFRHQKYPYADILKYLREKQNFSGNLYDVMVSYQNAKTDSVSDTIWYSNGYSEVPFVLHIDNRDGKESHTINIDYQTAVFQEEAEVRYIIERLKYIMMQIVEDYDRLISDINIILKAEKEKLIVEFNDTAVDYPRDKCVHELFMEQVRKTPDKTALVFEEKSFTYRQLDEMSNSLAHLLREKGAGRNDVVPIIAKRSWHVIVAMLGVLKAGGAYMPVAPDYPEERIKYMIRESNAKIVLLYQYTIFLNYVKSINLEDVDYNYKTGYIENCNFVGDYCYIIYTSGSTGMPKGICQTHLCLSNLILWQLSCEKDKSSNVLASTIISFDVSIQEMFYSLLAGKCLFFVQEGVKDNALLFVNYINKNKINELFTTPSYFNLVYNLYGLKKMLSLKNIYFAGEKLYLDKMIIEQLRLHNIKIWNQYGPAESHVATYKLVSNSFDITIGAPIANTQIYILDQKQNLLPIGVAGELCIAGDGVGKGYLNRSELTAERFIPNPFATEENGHGKIMYRTGDLARFRADGEIAYLGRIDTQVKIRGLRIELGEIESVMSGFPGIQLNAVTDKRDENNRQYLVGYYTSEASVDERKLREHLSAKLPKYMVPNYFIRLETMPMTSSGKTDRKNLPLPDFSMSMREYIKPETETEKKLAMIWNELLQIEQIGKTEDFFELGGDSLLAITLINRVEEEFHAGISVKEVMEHSVLEQLARVIEDANEKGSKIEARHKERYILLPQQKAIYAVCSKSPETLTYNISAQITLPISFNKERLKNCIVTVINRHQSLKTYISVENDDIYGVYDQTAKIVFEEYTEDTMSDFVRAFDLKKAPLMHIGFAKNILLFDIHHIIADGESLNIMLNDIFHLYSGKELSDLEIQYSDYAEHFWHTDFESHKAFFRDMLKGEFETVILPEKKTAQEGGMSKIFILPETIVQEVKSFTNKNALTDTMLYFGAFGILLSKYTAKADVLTSVILRNRLHKELCNVMGMFVNTLPVYLSAKGNLMEYFAKIKSLILDLYEYQEIPLLDVAKTVETKGRLVVNTSFVYQADGEKTLILDDQNLIAEAIYTPTAKFDLSMEVTPIKKGCKIRLEYDCAKYDEELINDLFAAYEKILTQLAVSETENIEDISILSEEEKHKLIVEFNDTAADYPRDKCVHELFVEQVQKTPDKTALVFEDEQFSYRQLDEMSNSLAHLLREKGVSRNDVVPIIAKRSWHVIVAMLGVLKAGGAYMLIDCQYPMERITYLVNECKADIVLSYGCSYGKNTIDLELVDYRKNVGLLDGVNKFDDVLCVIHTSGSSGVPKVSVLTHRNILHYIHYSAEFFTEVNQAIAATIITFDAFIQETIVALCRQIPVILLNDVQITNQVEFEDIINKYKNSFLFQTPTRLLSCIRNSKSGKFIKKLRKIVIGGEVFPQELYERIKLSNPESDIYNIYGPTETTVCVSVKKIEDGMDITVGTPIANTQIYILDQKQNLLPIGVAGELCIAGDGVGKGYLNRSELTAERFIPNPFATEENGHGKIMYRTGDLARFRADGEIEYLGRIDTQVKIRGLRIELGEIESVMSSFPRIQLSAVADKRDENDRQYLVGYYTSEVSVDERKLRDHLSVKLPKYMIPNYFVRLDDMPMTSSGKIDRKNLPLPDFTVNNAVYAAPETEREKLCCRILAELLGYEQIGVEDDFFEIGGDSLRAIEYTAKLHDKGVNLALQNIFDYPTVRKLCDFLESGMEKKIKYQAADFDKYQGLLNNNVMDVLFCPCRKSLGNILLTGSTGFLGAHILDVLMKEERGRIYCLIRGNSQKEAKDRIREILQYYFDDTYDLEIGKRIVPIVGDIEKEELAERTPSDIGTVIHAAASVKHYGSYSYFERINVRGTQHIINYAKKAGARLIHISTLSVSGNSMIDDFSAYRSAEEKFFAETSFYMDQPLDNVYIRSKFEAEKAVLDAMLEGMDAKIIRVGNLTNRASDYRFQPNYRQNAFLTRVKAALEFGLFPDYLMPLYTEFSPVDLTAEGVVKIAQYAGTQNVFHLNSNRPIYYDKLLEVLERLQIGLKVVDKDTFNTALRNTMKSRDTEYIYEAFQNDMDESGELLYDSNIHIENDFTIWFLKLVGFEWNEIDFEYIRGYVEYFRKIGFLEV